MCFRMSRLKGNGVRRCKIGGDVYYDWIEGCLLGLEDELG